MKMRVGDDTHTHTACHHVAVPLRSLLIFGKKTQGVAYNIGQYVGVSDTVYLCVIKLLDLIYNDIWR